MALRDQAELVLDAYEASIASLSADLAQKTADLAQAQASLAQIRAEYVSYVASHPHIDPPPVTPVPSPTPTPTPSTESRRHSLVAVRVFPSYSDKVYGNHPAVLARLGNLGIKRMSHKFSPVIAERKDCIDFTRRAYEQYGIKSWLTMGEPREVLTPAQWDKMEAVIRGPLAGMVELASGWNEPNHVRGGGILPTNWAQMAVSHNRELFRRFNGVVPKIGTPQLWSGEFGRHETDVKAVGAAGIKGTFNTITWHLYPRGTAGETLLRQFEILYRAHWDSFAQIICTEGGYLDAANYTGGAQNMTPSEKALLVPQYVDTYVKRGYGVSYFELLDDPDPTEADRESSLGLVECGGLDPSTWADKPAFGTLKKFLAS